MILFSIHVSATEVCNNGIDDDNDGLIDLNDTIDCFCTGLGVSNQISSLIPNPSFENYSYCPYDFSQLYCANNWQQATTATSDYFNQCDYNFLMGFTNNPSPYPDGNACVGFMDNYYSNPLHLYKEYIGSCLLSPLIAGRSYTLSLKIYTANTSQCYSDDLNLTIFGTSSCANFPISGTCKDCPTICSPNWIQLASTHVSYIYNTWQSVSITFTPTIDIESIIIGPGCSAVSNYNCGYDPTLFYFNYYYLDNLIINETSLFTEVVIDTIGSICQSNLELNATLTNPLAGASYQWFKDGIAIAGATHVTYNVPAIPTGLGFYQVQVSDGTNCTLSAKFQVTGASIALNSNILDASCGQPNGQVSVSPSGGNAPYALLWSGGSTNDTLYNLVAGTYDVTITDNDGCTDTASIIINNQVVTINPNSASVDASCGQSNGQASVAPQRWDCALHIFVEQWLYQ